MPKRPAARSLSDEVLTKYTGQRVTVYLTSAVALTGQLLRYDADTLIITDEEHSGEEVPVTRRHVTVVRKPRSK